MCVLMFDVLMKVPKQRMVFKFKHNEIAFCNIEKIHLPLK